MNGYYIVGAAMKVLLILNCSGWHYKSKSQIIQSPHPYVVHTISFTVGFCNSERPNPVLLKGLLVTIYLYPYSNSNFSLQKRWREDFFHVKFLPMLNIKNISAIGSLKNFVDKLRWGYVCGKKVAKIIFMY